MCALGVSCEEKLVEDINTPLKSNLIPVVQQHVDVLHNLVMQDAERNFYNFIHFFIQFILNNLCFSSNPCHQTH